MAKKRKTIKKTKKRLPKRPLVKIVFSNAAEHTNEQADHIQTWVAGQMLDYHRDRKDFGKLVTARYYG